MGSRDDGESRSRLDGGLTEVERVGETVHRTVGLWTPAVHALLAHLERVGFEGAPRPLGIDSEGREVLRFVPGGGPSHADDELVGVAQLTRALHDSTESFEVPPDAEWQFMVGAPRRGEVVCHNDLSPDNTIWRRQHHASGTWRGRSIDSSPSTTTQPASDSATRLSPDRHGCEPSATPITLMAAKGCLRPCVNAFASCTTRLERGVKPAGRVGATCGGTRAASSGWADCATSRRIATSGSGNSSAASRCPRHESNMRTRFRN
jgi:hypothetical protein